MQAIKILLTVCSFIAITTSQSSLQRQHQNGQLENSDRLYFSDNRPPHGEQTKNVRQTSDNYGQGQSNKLFGPTQYSVQQSTNQDVNYNVNDKNFGPESVPQPSVDLQPPLYSESNKPMYFAYNQRGQDFVTTESNINTRHSGSDDNQQVPMQNDTYSQIDSVSLAITNFGLTLMKFLNQNQTTSNIVVSPYSITTLLALLQQGALGETQQQITRALQMSPEASVTAYKKLTDDIQKRTSARNILKVANNVFVADTFDLNAAFKRNARFNFGSEITPISFVKPERAVEQINRWVADKTRNNIEKIVTPEIIGENSQLVLANAIYFKGIWESMFKPEHTAPAEFRLANGQTKRVSFMRIKKIMAQYGFDDTIKAEILLLPFEREQYSFMVILPTPETNLDIVLSSLTDIKLAHYQQFRRQELEVRLPKFTVKTDTNLNPILMKMGITSVFGPQSELSSLGTYRNFSPQISSAQHTAMLSIDEQGGTASAATTFVVVALSYEEETIYNANRPFIAVLWDNQNSIPLFMSRIEDPSL